MLQAPTNDRKTKAEASSKTAKHLPEYEQSSQLMGGIGRSRQSQPLQQRENLAALQKAYGNQAVLRMKGRSPAANPLQKGILQRKCACGNTAGSSGSCTECQSKQEGILQTKLQISEPGDRYEQEADRVADQVMGASAHSILSSAPPRIQRFTGQATEGSDTVPASVDQTLASPGRPLDPLLQQDMEQRFSYDFSKVRVHSGTAAEQSARDVNAKAYTAGRNIVFGFGQFAPGTQEGRRLIAHELTHVVQQSGPAGIYFDRSSGKRDSSPIAHTIQRQDLGANIDEDSDDQSFALVEVEESTPVATAEITPSLAPVAAGDATGATAEITLETGNATSSPVNNYLHQQICIDRHLDGNGSKLCFSFAKLSGSAGVQAPQFSSTWLGWSSYVVGAILRGEVYEAEPVSGAEINSTLTPTATEGARWLSYMINTRLGLQDGYSILNHNCRRFSQWEFEDAPSHF